MEKHPLMIDDGEAAFTPPAAVQAACKAALDAKPQASAFAMAIATHIAGGQPISLEKVGKLAEFFAGAEANGAAATAALLGGDLAKAWASDVLAGENGGYRRDVEVIKVDEALGIVFGWAIISKEGGKDYFDTQGDHIPEAAMLKAAADFMTNSRVLGDMHKEAEGGTVLFAFPLTGDTAKAFGLTTTKTGLMIGVKPANAETLAKFKSGEYTGFSIGGRRVRDEEVN